MSFGTRVAGEKSPAIEEKGDEITASLLVSSIDAGDFSLTLEMTFRFCRPRSNVNGRGAGWGKGINNHSVCSVVHILF
jgi:hypothetical protein